ncbi:hypothetical protein F5Y16DRAFT_54886 [Xylariaceae sp. FL0255]|nr:hypothetical protein F5Y16DRAFT_54886 [Xylariaceae sp. FL0255]
MFTATQARLSSAPVSPFAKRVAAAAQSVAQANSKAKPLGVYNSIYKPKKVWPPDFTKLSEKQQFRFEKRYKRRIALASQRPNWDRYTRMAQYFVISTVIVYTALFMDWETDNHPLQGFRDTVFSAFDAFNPSQRDVRRKPDLPTGPAESK